jgi:hypothetical protein
MIGAGPDGGGTPTCKDGCEGRCALATFSHKPAQSGHDRVQWSRLAIRETWGSLAITAMWIAVSVAAIWGPDIVSSSSSGSTTSVPSAVAVALFATLASWIVARYCFGRDRKD